MEVETIILKSVMQSFLDFQRKPFHFMYENDIQSHLFSLLRAELKDEKFSIPLSGSVKDLPDASMHLINTEYGKNRTDIACLDKDCAEREIEANKGHQLSDFLWQLPILVGIEMKLIPYNDFSKGFDICRKDQDKLLKNPAKNKQAKNFKWLMLTYFQNNEALIKLRLKISNEYQYKEIEVSSNEISFNKIYLVSPGASFCYWSEA